MNISEFSIRRKVTTLMVFMAILVFGIMAYTTLSLDLMPNINLPIAMVQASYRGAAPQEIETMVTRPLEQGIARVGGVKSISSTSSEGSSMIMIQFADGTDMDMVMLDMREKIDMVKPYFPDGVSAPIIMALDPSALPIIQYGLSGDDLAALQQTAEDVIAPKIERINGVASVDIMGGFDQSVTISTYGERLQGYHINIDYISKILMAENLSVPSGQVQNGSNSLTVRTTGEFQSVEDIKNVLIPLPTGGSVRLSELAQVQMEPKEITTIAKLDGEPCVAVIVQKQSDVNTVKVADEINKTMAGIIKDNPHLHLVNLMDQSTFVKETVNTVMSNILLGVLAAVLVLWFFLKNLRSTFIVAISMPLCIVATFVVMVAFDLTMNMMTLGGIAMGVGMIVDNSIVVLENIHRFMQEGKERRQACIEGAKEVSLAITASTLTTIAVFLPIGLSSGMAGMLFKEFCITIAALLILSLVIALTLVPLLSYFLMHVKKTDGGIDNPRYRGAWGFYEKCLGWAIKHKGASIVLCIVMMVGFLVASFSRGFELIPSMDQSMITVNITTPVGTSLTDTTVLTDRLMADILEVPEVDNMFYSAEGTASSMIVNLVPKGERNRSINEIADQFRSMTRDIAGCEVAVSAEGMMSFGSMTGAAISISVSGSDFDTLEKISLDLKKIIESVPGTREVKTSFSERIPQVKITLKNEIASKYGLNSASVGGAVKAQLSGVTSTQLKLSGNEIDVIVKGAAQNDQGLDALKSLQLPLQSGGTVPLTVVADVDIELGPTQIVRENQARTVTISGDVLGVDVMTANTQVQEKIDAYALPDGYHFQTGGQMEELITSFTSMLYALIIAVALVYFILASQFESLLLPLIVMLVMPIGLSGGLFGSFLTASPVSIPAFIGVIMLAGIVVNNSIVLVDYIRTRRGFGEDRTTAILRACPLRVRPVLMTTLTTVLGLIPMMLGTGQGGEVMAPMAIVMAVGLIISTVITLIFTPVFYVVLDDISSGLLNLFSGKKRKKKAIETQTKVG